MKTICKQGYALITVMGIMAVLAITFTMMLKMGKQSAFTGKLLVDRTKAAAYAEAGIEYAYSIIRDNYNNRTNPAAFWTDTSIPYTDGAPLLSTYGEGTFNLTLTNINAGQYIIVNSVGTCGQSSVEVEAFIEDTTYVPLSEGGKKAYEYAIFGGGGNDGKPNKFAGGGPVQTPPNPDLEMFFGGLLEIKGGIEVGVSLVSATGIDLKKKDINGTATAPIVDNPASGYVPDSGVDIAPISMPGLDFTRLFNEAVKTGDYHDMNGGELIINASTPINGPVIYVDGDVRVQGDINASIVATGDITILSGSVTGSTEYGIAAATTNGNITDNSTGDHWGLFYSKTGNFSQGASAGEIVGQIIVGGIVEKTGGKALIFELTVPEEIFITANPEIAAWQK